MIVAAILVLALAVIFAPILAVAIVKVEIVRALNQIEKLIETKKENPNGNQSD